MGTQAYRPIGIRSLAAPKAAQVTRVEELFLLRGQLVGAHVDAAQVDPGLLRLFQRQDVSLPDFQEHTAARGVSLGDRLGFEGRVPGAPSPHEVDAQLVHALIQTEGPRATSELCRQDLGARERRFGSLGVEEGGLEIGQDARAGGRKGQEVREEKGSRNRDNFAGSHLSCLSVGCVCLCQMMEAFADDFNTLSDAIVAIFGSF